MVSSESFTVYHGTNLFAAKLMFLYGIRLEAQRRLSDFGKGFYVTFNKDQAKNWALVRANNKQVATLLLDKLNIPKKLYLSHSDVGIPAVISFQINLQNLLQLNGKIFPFPNDLSWSYYHEEWKQFVYKCRAGLRHKYDFVYGPIGGGHFKSHKKIKVSKTKDQLSLNTPEAISCLSEMKILYINNRVFVNRNFNDEKKGVLLNEIKEVLLNNFRLTVDIADELVYKSWVTYLTSDVLLHESPLYWALCLFQGGKSLWYKEYEDKLLSRPALF